MNQPSLKSDQLNRVESAHINKSSFPEARIAWIEACWHQDIVSNARLHFTDKIADHGIDASRIDVFEVPGSLEIPLQTKLLAKTGNYDVIIASGMIVDGGIYRHDFVAATVLDAMMQVSLESEIPVLSVVLTPQHFHESDDHHDFFFEHFKKKGVEAANACVKTLQNMDNLKKQAAG